MKFRCPSGPSKVGFRSNRAHDSDHVSIDRTTQTCMLMALSKIRKTRSKSMSKRSLQRTINLQKLILSWTWKRVAEWTSKALHRIKRCHQMIEAKILFDCIDYCSHDCQTIDPLLYTFTNLQLCSSVSTARRRHTINDDDAINSGSWHLYRS